jgi:hypothetical protein
LAANTFGKDLVATKYKDKETRKEQENVRKHTDYYSNYFGILTPRIYQSSGYTL